MTFSDILKKSFLENYTSTEIGTLDVIISLVLATLIGLYIYQIYKIALKKVFYSRGFNESLVLLTIITTSIILTIQFSVVVSLGMVGALSIVRFRTAIKEPIDLVFLFWAISIGIICGARQYIIAIILSVILSIVIFLLEEFPSKQHYKIIIINAKRKENVLDDIENQLREGVKKYEIKSYNISGEHVNLIIEINTTDENKMVEILSEKDYIENVSLVTQTGDVTY